MLGTADRGACRDLAAGLGRLAGADPGPAGGAGQGGEPDGGAGEGIVFAARSSVAPAGTWLPAWAAWAALTRGPGAFANSEPMTLPGSLEVPIMKPGRAWPRIQAGAAAPPIIHW